jgi:CDP-diacylglycerol--glycerol-3-phosphate 3-phosphatidyltransferase
VSGPAVPGASGHGPSGGTGQLAGAPVADPPATGPAPTGAPNTGPGIRAPATRAAVTGSVTTGSAMTGAMTGGGLTTGALTTGAGPAIATFGFGPSALATPANAITVVRLLAAPILVIMVLHRPTSWLTMGVWTVLAGTDGIDGWLARRHGTTRSGAFLDPLADKFLVLGAMFALVSLERLPLLPVALIAGREIVISVYRVVVARQGVSVPARPLAKAKTVVQSLAVATALLPPIGDGHPAVALALLWLAVGLTLITGLQYLLDGKRSPAAGTVSL